VSVAPPPATDLARRVLRSASALTLRQVFVGVANVAGGVLLARLLSPAEFGAFAMLSILISMFLVVAGPGVAAELVRREAEPDPSTQAAVFTVQLAVSFALALAIWMLAPWLVDRFGLGPSAGAAFRLAALAGLVTTFAVMPQVHLERELAFDRLAIVEVAQAIAFNGVAIVMAWSGYGLASIGFAYLVKHSLGAAVAHWLAPWAVRLRWDWPRTAGVLRFGVPYQGAAFVSILKDSITPIAAGLIVGVAEVGFLTWASMFASYAVLALVILQRIYMPTFARLQSSPELLRGFVEHTIWAANAVMAPISLVLLVHAEAITRIVFGEKWLVALPLFYLFWGANLVVPTVTPVLGLLNATGRSKLTFAFNFMWTGLTWAIGLPLLYVVGAIGLAIANPMVQATNLLLFREVRRRHGVRFLRFVLPPWLLAIPVVAIGRFVPEVLGLRADEPAGLVVSVGVSMGLYAIAMVAANWSKVRWVMNAIKDRGLPS
jgi:O-antigen/teichoic acid export membrane protein